MEAFPNMKWQYIRATIEGGFWRAYRDLVRTEVVPYQWKALNDAIPGAPRSHSVENLRIAGGLSAGEYHGMVFQDSDLYKWLEAAGFLLADGLSTDEEIRKWSEQSVDLIAKAQQPDGYLNTYFTVKSPERRWKNLREAHELYCAGHLIEAGVAVFRGTGNRKILDVVCGVADLIDRTFGTETGKIRAYPGHEEVELALVKLYRATGETRYLQLARYFIDERGKSPNYFDEETKDPAHFSMFGTRENSYSQSHVPVREQTDAVGHSVRAMYLYIAMADIAFETGDDSLKRACERLWESTTGRRMYVTGGIGSSARFEAFTADYDLPNDTAYAETCASIGLFIFSNRMAVLTGEGKYADVMERTLFNGIISGLAQDGQSYFYVNPLEVVPSVCDSNPTHEHVKYRRQAWYGCACCPPNIARLLSSLGEYVYHVDGSTLYVDLFHDGSISCSVAGTEISLRQSTNFPWAEEVTFEYTGSQEAEFDLAIRIPAWCTGAGLSVNGQEVLVQETLQTGYAHLKRSWRPGDTVQLDLPMPVRRVYSHPGVHANWGKVAIMRGPMVYCMEEADNGKGLHSITLERDAALEAQYAPDLLGGVVTVKAQAQKFEPGKKNGELNPGTAADEGMTPRKITFIPYYTWANRSAGEMRVWVQERPVPWKTD